MKNCPKDRLGINNRTNNIIFIIRGLICMYGIPLFYEDFIVASFILVKESDIGVDF